MLGLLTPLLWIDATVNALLVHAEDFPTSSRPNDLHIHYKVIFLVEVQAVGVEKAILPHHS